MVTSYGLNESAFTTLIGAAGSASGQAQIGPNNPHTRWHVTRLTVLTTANVGDPSAVAYLGTVSPGNSLGGTYSGAQDSTDLDVWLWPGQFITVAWENGDSNARATVSIFGEVESSV